MTPPKLPALVVLAALALSARASEPLSVYDTLATKAEHTIVLSAAKEAGEAKKLTEKGEWTLFAPTDSAFDGLNAGIVEAIVTDKKAAPRLIGAHLVNKKYTAEKLRGMNGQVLNTVNGGTLKVEVINGEVRVGGVKVGAEFACNNGVIHVVDAMLPLPKE